jgi:GTP-binding protein
LRILSAEFVTSAASGAAIPKDGLPQVALVGRSNVGKSSLINALVQRKVARTSAAPGKTRLANLYRVNLTGTRRISFYFVDLPGYGYARGGRDAGAELRGVAEAYLTEPRGAGHEPRHALLLVDSRHPSLDSDRQAAAWLESLAVETRIVATKIDKLTRAERARNLNTLGETFGKAALPVSAASGEGLDELWKMIVKIVRDEDTAG